MAKKRFQVEQIISKRREAEGTVSKGPDDWAGRQEAGDRGADVLSLAEAYAGHIDRLNYALAARRVGVHDLALADLLREDVSL
jgi:hypothetical protein